MQCRVVVVKVATMSQQCRVVVVRIRNSRSCGRCCENCRSSHGLTGEDHEGPRYEQGYAIFSFLGPHHVLSCPRGALLGGCRKSVEKSTRIDVIVLSSQGSSREF